MKSLGKCLATAAFSASFATSAWADRTVHVVLVRTANTDGTLASSATAANFKWQIDTANTVYAGSGVNFAFDPAQDFPPVVKDNLLNHDFSLMAGETLSAPKANPPRVDGSLFAKAKNAYARSHFPGKLVVYSGYGDELKYMDAQNKWAIVQRSYAYSNMVDQFVQFGAGDGGYNLFAHEGGHYLHLFHTFAGLPANQAEAQTYITDALTKYGYTTGNIASAFDGDGLADTPPDAGPGLWQSLTGQACSAQNTITVPYTWQGNNYQIQFNTDRLNVMSYFKDCAFAQPHHISAEQAAKVRRAIDIGNRLPLINSNPGAFIQQWSPDVAVASWGPGRLDVFVAGADSSIRHRAFDNGAWYPTESYDYHSWEFMGGYTVGQPAAVSWGPNRIDVFVRGSDNAMYHKWWDGQNWGPSLVGWEFLGGVLAGKPVAVSWGSGRLDIFARGYDGNLQHKAWSPQTGWSPSVSAWEVLGGKISSDPTAVSWGEGRLDVFARGSEGNLVHKAYAGNWYPAGSDLENLGGAIVGNPAATAWSANRLDIVVRGTDNALYHKAWTGTAWYPSLTGFSSLGGAISADPSLTSWGPGRLDILVTGTDTRMYHKSYDANFGGWSPSVDGWNALGGYSMKKSNPLIMSNAPGHFDMFMRGDDYEFMHKSWDNATGWLPGLSIWEKIGKYIE